MADYWVSQARKYCDFCKCWISDNKPSVQFHENGKRHRAAVEAKIKAIGKKSIADEKAKIERDNDFKKMEEAAMKAYMRDLQQNPDLSSQVKNNVDVPMVGSYKSTVEVKKTEWHEAKTDEGDVYYWHSVTGESKWEVPTEGFISLKNQSVKTAATAVAKKPPPKPGKRKDTKHKHQKPKKMREDKSNKTKHEIMEMPETMGPVPRGQPFGHWETVENEGAESVDLQLPEPTLTRVKLKRFLDEVDEPETEFKEKTVASSEAIGDPSSSTPTSFQFKKPKNRGNVRQRTSE